MYIVTQAFLWAAGGTGFTALMTALGASMVFLFRRQSSPSLHRVMLGFAAGAMFYVVVEELIPEATEGDHSDLGVLLFAAGFTVMMVLDVVLG